MSLTTCLWFDGNAQAAAEFYVQNFPGSRLGGHEEESSNTSEAEIDTPVMVDFTIFDQPFMALNGGPAFHFTPAISFQIPCADQSEIDHYWDLLTTDGGEPGQCGWLCDKFGISWQVISPLMGRYLGGADAVGAQAALHAMLSMTKIDLEQMRLVYESSLTS